MTSVGWQKTACPTRKLAGHLATRLALLAVHTCTEIVAWLPCDIAMQAKLPLHPGHLPQNNSRSRLHVHSVQ